VVLEQGRARVLGQALERDRAELDRLAALGHADLRDRYQAADEAVTRLLATDAAPQEVAAAHAALLGLTGEIRAVPGWSGFRSPADLPDILAAAREHPLIYVLAAGETGLALVVSDGAVRPCWLPGLTWTDLVAEQSALNDAFQAWASATPAAAAAARDRYQQAFGRVCRWLGSAAMGPLLDDLPAAGRVTLVACGRLGGLPLHAAVLPAGDEGADRYALDRALITYAPSALALTRAANTRDRLAADRVLVISDPRGPADKHLPAAVLEAAAIARHFPPDGRTVLADTAATPERVTAVLGEVSVLHAACHAVSDPAHPLDSALLLAEGTRLTVRQLTDRPVAGDRRLRLAVLSACESAAIGTAAPDELVGLPSALLEAGAAAVVASLILVPDRPTALLMLRFYEHWRTDGMPAPDALRRAQQWLRDASNEDLLRLHPGLVAAEVPAGGLRYRIWAQARPHRDPTHWAGFTYLGA
jgi:CHAT domain-containing protein